MRFYGFDEQFYRDAKKAELSMANIHVKIRRLKTALIGGKLPIIRLVVMLLPLVSLLIPSATVSIKLPFSDTEMLFSALGIYNAFSGGTINLIMDMTAATIDGAVFTSLFHLLISYTVCILLAVFTLLLTILCFINIKKMSIVLCTVSGLGFVSCGVAAVFIKNFCDTASASSGQILSANSSFGYIITAVMFAVVFAVNLIIAKRGLKIEYDEGAIERVEIYKKVRRGEISIDDLPQPVVETAETRAIDEEIRKQQEQYREKENERSAQSSEV